MKPRRLHSATISSSVGPAAVSVASVTRPTLPIAAALLRADAEPGRLALRVADLELEDQLRPSGQSLARLDGAFAEGCGEGPDGLLRLQLQQPLRMRNGDLAAREAELLRQFHAGPLELLAAGLD